MPPSTPKQVLRTILHNLRNKVDLLDGADSSAGTTRHHVLQLARRHHQNPISSATSTTSPPVGVETTMALRAMASSYAKLLTDLKERERLYQLDTGAENQLTPKEMSRRAAARSGLLLPQLNPDLDKK